MIDAGRLHGPNELKIVSQSSLRVNGIMPAFDSTCCSCSSSPQPFDFSNVK